MYITGNAMAKSLLAFLSKPTTVTILIILILLDVNHLKRIHSVCTFGVAIFEKTPFFILSLCAGLLELKREMGIGARRVHPETTLDFRSRENP